MRIQQAAAAVSAALLAGALLAGCSDDEPRGADWPTPSLQPSRTPSSASTSPAGLVEPALPAAAAKATKSGASAFVAYYWTLVSYALTSGDTGTLAGLAGPACDGCRGGTNWIDEVYGAGGRIAASPYEITDVELARIPLRTGDLLFRAYVTTHTGDQVTKVPGKKDEHFPAATERLEMALLFINGRWRVDVLRSR